MATFANLRLARPGSSYTLVATSGTLTGATSPPFAVVVTPLIAFVNEDQAGVAIGIATMPPDGSSVVSLTASGADAAPAWSPDGTKIAFLRGLPCGSGATCFHAFTMNADGTGVTDILPGDAGTAPTWLAWKPGGSRIASTGTYQHTAGLYLMDPDGSHVALVLAGMGLGHPSWSPDGLRLAVECVDNADLCVVNADGTGLAPLLSDADGEQYRPAWKPDGTRIVFVELSPGVSGSLLTVINPDGSFVADIGGQGGDFPTWSPDGLRIAFMLPAGCGSFERGPGVAGGRVAARRAAGGVRRSQGCGPDAINVANGDGSGQPLFIHAGTQPTWRP